MSPPPQILIPYNPREAINLRQAAKIAGKSESTVRSWCALYHIGRRVVGGPWQVSRVALAMLLNGDDAALNAYLAGDRDGAAVAGYFADVVSCQPHDQRRRRQKHQQRRQAVDA